jgi:hypothetical protein
MPSDYKLIYDDHRLDYGRKLTLWAQDHRMSDEYGDVVTTIDLGSHAIYH